MKTDRADKEGKAGFRRMTAAHLREEASPEYIEVVFLESARFYKLPRKNLKFAEIVRELRESVKKKHGVDVLMEAAESNVIQDVQAAR